MKSFLSLIAGFLIFSCAPAFSATTLTVFNASGDSTVPGSLPYYIFGTSYASTTNPYHLPVDTFYNIKFNIPQPGQITINLQSTMYVGAQVNIDATTQPGYNGAPLITLSGSNGTSGVLASIFYLTSTSSSNNNENTIQGFCIVGFSSNGITISNTSQGNFIQNNYLGFTYGSTAGTYTKNSDLGNASTRAIGIASSYNTIRYNTIDGTDNAVAIGDDPTVAPGLNETSPQYITNDIQYNYIGTDPTGNAKFPGSTGFGNTTDAIFLGAGAGYTFIGPGNVLSGNAIHGVELLHKSVQGNVVFANDIGVGKDGKTPIPNGQLGVLVSNGSYFNAIGGSFGGNVISCNTLGAIAIGLPSLLNDGETSTAGYLVYVQNNLIGTDSTGEAVPANSSQNVGITIQGGSTQAIVTGNVIGGETQHGVAAYSSSYCYIASNWIGESYNGVSLPNGAYGVYFDDVYDTYEIQNAFGTNGLGSFGSTGGGSNDIQ